MNRTGTLGAAMALALVALAVIGVSSAAAAGFVANEYPAKLQATQTTTPKFGFGLETVECESQSSETTSLVDGAKTIAPAFGDVSCSQGSLKMNGCTFVFHPEGEGEGEGTVEIGPSGCGSVTVTSRGCERLLPAQGGLAATFENSGEGASAGVDVSIEAFGIEYVNQSTAYCGSKGTKTNGTFSGNLEISAENASGKSIGTSVAASAVYLAGEESGEAGEQPRIESEWSSNWAGHAVLISGEQSAANPFSATFGVRTIECAGAGLSGAALEGVAALWGEYEGCTATGGVPVSVATNGCYYVLSALNSGPPYAGGLEVFCFGSDAIEFKLYSSKANQEAGKTMCVYKVGSQEGLTGIGLENVGSGIERGIAMNMELSSIQYTVASGTKLLCGSSAGNGTYSGGTTLLGL